MAHSRLVRGQMFDWLRASIEAGSSAPDDAAICERFNFCSTESARTLLADLADAGLITIKGHGSTRVITLGRGRTVVPPASRPIRSVTKADPEVEETFEKIMAIARRPAARDGGAVPPAELSAPPPKKVAASTKTIMLPATATSAIAAVESHAQTHGLTFGQSAAQLIDRGAEASIAASSDIPLPLQLEDIHLDALLDEVRRRFEKIAAITARAQTAEAQVEDLNAKLAHIRAAAA